MGIQGKKFVNYCVIITLCCMVTLLCNIPVCAAESDYEYSVDENNEVTITKYVGTETEVVIPDTLGGGKVTRIDNYAFRFNSSLTSIKIPEGVTRIGWGAFENCSSLTSITIPESVTSMGDGVFPGCSSLKTAGPIGSGSDIEFGWKTSIPGYAFYKCSSLTSITIPESVTSIGGNAFGDCSSLTGITIPKGVTSIGGYAFSGCISLSSITIPKNVTSIGDSAFSDCNLLIEINVAADNSSYASLDGVLYNKDMTCMVVFPAGKEEISFAESVNSINSGAFRGCINLTSITLPEGITSIGSRAFDRCSSLTRITIPESVTSMGWYMSSGYGVGVFSGCSNLKTAGPIGSGSDIEFGWKTSIPDYAFGGKGCGLSSITIPESVTSIGKFAFGNCSSLSSITIPEGVTSIGDHAFYACTSLSSITIPESMTSIGSSALSYCSSLKTAGPIGSGSDIEFGWKTSIPDFAFTDCRSLSSITIPESVTSIGDSAFSDCSNLSSITIPESVTSIGDSAFSGCSSLKTAGPIGSGSDIEFGWKTSIPGNAFKGFSSLTSIIIPEGVTSIGYYAFLECSSLTSITISESVTSIGKYAFLGCSSLSSITIPEGVTSIGDSAFSGCSSLSSITIPESVTSIGSSALSNCSSLKTAGPIGSGSDIEFGWKTGIPGNAFKGFSSLTSIIIPENVTSIGYSAFSDCSSLSSITIPEGVTSIGYSAFSGCSSLSSITIPESVTSIGDSAFSECSSLTSITIPEGVTSIGPEVFLGCSSLKTAGPIGSGSDIEFGWKTGIPENAFKGFSSLTSIIISENVTSIGDSAFSGCSSLSSITIPEGVTSIGTEVFSGCSSLKTAGPIGSGSDIEFGWKTSIPDFAFSDCSNLSSITIPESVTGIGTNAFYDCRSLSSITIPKNVTSIGNGAFRACSSLSSITIPESVTSIGDHAFYDCRSLNSITIPESVTSIGDSAFGYCIGLSSITIPRNVMSIGDYAFCYCSSLISITIPESVTSIGNGAFRGCSSLSSITIPKNATSIGGSAFRDCSSLSSITIPESVTIIGGYAFYKCSSLSSITIPESVTIIGKYAFSNCTGLTKISNNSAIVIELSSINPNVSWYDIKTGEVIEQLGTGTVVTDKEMVGSETEKPVEIEKSDITMDEGAGFVDKDGNKVETDDIVIGKTPINQPEQDIVQTVEEIIKNVTTKANVFYYDISAYINVVGGEKAVLDGGITIKFNYPDGITKEHDIIVLHKNLKLEDVKKYDTYFTFKTDGFSPFTIIATETEKTEPLPAGDEEQVRAFVKRLYTLVLEREAEESGIDSWTKVLLERTSSGVDTGYGFVFSEECQKRGLSDEDFVNMLYLTFMNRPSDEAGRNAWVSQLEIGVEREKVFEGFVYSDEFRGICEEYGIEVGNTESVDAFAEALGHYCNQNADITAFVARCYTKAMGRPYDPVGLEDWCRVIITQDDTPTNVAKCFIFSDEFVDKGLSDEEYVKVLYRTFMGREADDDGLSGWVGVLKSGEEDREKVLDGFANSEEFAGILESFGLN